MKNQLRKFQFTLVEVLIAMGICVIGVVFWLTFSVVGGPLQELLDGDDLILSKDGQIWTFYKY